MIQRSGQSSYRSFLQQDSKEKTFFEVALSKFSGHNVVQGVLLVYQYLEIYWFKKIPQVQQDTIEQTETETETVTVIMRLMRMMLMKLIGTVSQLLGKSV